MHIPAIRVRQWLTVWDSYEYDDAARQAKPKPYFYICSIPASVLRRLSGIRHRDASGPRAADIGIQRGHDEKRSKEIERFVLAGYPWASLNTRDQERFPRLKKPGWLPTAIVANVIGETSTRNGSTADPRDLISIQDVGGENVHLVLPDGAEIPGWEPGPESLMPVEIIDGQHRLFAFTEADEPDGDFELPVVLFDDLAIGWQAYLFWSINVTPKRINPSMAYDLYPLLRTAEWLENIEGPLAYRETRAQELTEALWSHPDSPWRERIGMLGRERGKVTQAAFVRSLTLSFVRGWSGSKRTGIGGLFGAEHGGARAGVLQWNRAQQAAYLIALWSHLRDALNTADLEWAAFLRENTKREDTIGGLDPALAGRFSMLATDQGVRGFLQVCNDISYAAWTTVPFDRWQRRTRAEATDIQEVTAALEELRLHSALSEFTRTLSSDVATFDWRSAVTPGLPHDVEIFQSRYRSGSGYKQVRMQLLIHLSKSGSDLIATHAETVARALGYIKD